MNSPPRRSRAISRAIQSDSRTRERSWSRKARGKSIASVLDIVWYAWTLIETTTSPVLDHRTIGPHPPRVLEGLLSQAFRATVGLDPAAYPRPPLSTGLSGRRE